MAHGRNKYQSRENRARIRALFRIEWDPIGLPPDGPAGEYDPYVSRAYVMLMDERAEASAIASYLFDEATRHMGLSPSARLKAKCEKTASLLVAMRPEFETH